MSIYFVTIIQINKIVYKQNCLLVNMRQYIVDLLIATITFAAPFYECRGNAYIICKSHRMVFKEKGLNIFVVSNKAGKGTVQTILKHSL